jgi:hypothetical protein
MPDPTLPFLLFVWFALFDAKNYFDTGDLLTRLREYGFRLRDAYGG